MLDATPELDGSEIPLLQRLSGRAGAATSLLERRIDRQAVAGRGCRQAARAVLAATLLFTLRPPVAAQLTLDDNELWDPTDFDISADDSSQYFGVGLARCDFNGDGYEDLAIGSSGADLLGVLNGAGAVYVAYGGPSGLSLAGHQTLVQPTTGEDPPAAGDGLGMALAAGDFNGDGWCDLAAGSPGDDIGDVVNAGAVHVFSGSGGGLLSSSQVWHQDQPGVLELADTYEGFGSVLAAGDFNGDGYDDLAVGVPHEGDASQGAVHVLFGTGEGLSAAGDDLIYQGDAQGTFGALDGNDFFGAAIAVGHFNSDSYADLAVGVPGEDDGGIGSVGIVHVFYGWSSGFLARDRLQQVFDQEMLDLSPESEDRFGAALAAGDFDGDGIDELAVGSREGVGLPGAEAIWAGSVVVLRGQASGLTAEGAQVFTQDAPGVSDSAEDDDLFGYALTAGDFDGDARADLAIGVIGEDFEGGGHVNNGALHVLYGSSSGLTTEGEQFHGQSVWGVGATESYDQFGEHLVAGDFDGDGVDALAVGIPFEDYAGNVDAGRVAVITGVAAPLFADGFESGDGSAWSLAVP